jgi:hypothetical protein
LLGRWRVGVRLTASFNVEHLAVLFLVPVEPDVGNEDIPVMRYKVFDDPVRCFHNVHVPPVDPAMLRLQSSSKEIVACPAQSFAPRSLCLKAVSILDVLRELYVEILLHDHCGTKGSLLDVLHSRELQCQCRHCVVGGVANNEGQVNKLVRVRELCEQVEVRSDVLGSIAEGREDKHPLPVANSVCGGVDIVEIDVLYYGAVHLDGRVVVEEYGRVHVRVPVFGFVGCHAHWRFRGAEAVESEALC